MLKNGSLSLGSHEIFKELSFSVSYNHKIGILGRNGAGKTTLLKVIAKTIPLDGGTLTYNKNKTIAMIELIFRN